MACKAYAVATENSVSGCDMRAEDFNHTLLQTFKTLAPIPTPEGTYHLREHCAYPYLRDSVFCILQKFHKSIRRVEASCPSGVTEQQKINMAVAIHVGKTNKMDYDFKDFEASSWRLYFASKNLQCLPKFSIVAKKLAPSDEVSLLDDVSPISTVTAHSIYKQKGKEGML